MTIGANAKYITFDCYGTLVNWQMDRKTKQVLGQRLPAEKEERFLETFSVYRFDEVLGDWKPYRDIIRNAARRAAKWVGIEYRESDGDQIYEDIGNWGPHPDVPEALRALATRHPLVILSNAADDQIAHNVAKLGAPFHRVLTAQQARAYKPRLAAFEYMFDTLGARPEEIIHVSSDPEYDHRPAFELGIGTRIFVNRSRWAPRPWLDYHEIKVLTELPKLLGIETGVPVS